MKPMLTETKEMLAKVRRMDIHTRGLVNQIFSGEYHSVFKGRGMSFAEVREYQWGDDARWIDWNVSARFDRTYIKLFEEERELTLMILYDASASNRFGTIRQTKADLMTELSAVLAFSAIQNNDKAGIVFFTDQVEKYIVPKKGRTHGLRIIRELLTIQPTSEGTQLTPAIEFAFHALKRRSIVFIISDFMAENFSRPLKILARKHDVIAIRISDRHETDLPSVGLVTLVDPETKRQITVDTGSLRFLDEYRKNVSTYRDTQKYMLLSAGVDLIELETGKDYSRELIRFFRNRAKRLAYH